MIYVCIRDGCFNQTTEVLCKKHRAEVEAAALTPEDTVRSALEGDPGDVADGLRLAADLLDDLSGDPE